MLDFRMETFLAVCQYLSYTKAAEHLHITQPAVSQHIRCLEEHYGVKLFTRNKKKIELTQEGALVRSSAIAMKHDDIFLKRKLSEAVQASELLFGVTLTVGEYVIPPVIAGYLKKHRGISVKMLVANTRELLKKLDNGEIDFALVEGYFAKNEYEHLVFRSEPFAAVCGMQYRFAGVPRVVEDLLKERILVREEGSGTREILEKYLEERNLLLSDFKAIAEISSLETIKLLAKENCGIAFLYEAVVEKELKEGSLQKIPLENFDIRHDMTFLWRQSSIFAEDYRLLYEEFKK